MALLWGEGLLYAKLLKQKGMKTKDDVYPGVPHRFHYGLRQIKIVFLADKDFDNELKWLLSGSSA
ncbi:hypothetical protein SCP_0412330 [Sparassis crispa]|uniref:Uncharacterized protein n=1 Tax=Sparassis crispa TaxID=139825 RepID=A0A401GL07_9APHY|nr:hypothetical protein SCP_0412330 [Sparassis crispa]GBE82846.1 hypothetical protein SCP_0412330 [Sparassis crispa]